MYYYIIVNRHQRDTHTHTHSLMKKISSWRARVPVSKRHLLRSWRQMRTRTYIRINIIRISHTPFLRRHPRGSKNNIPYLLVVVVAVVHNNDPWKNNTGTMTRNTTYMTMCIREYIYNVWCKNPFFPYFFSSISILQPKMLFIPAEVSSRHLQVLSTVTHLLRFSDVNGCIREYVKGSANKTITIYIIIVYVSTLPNDDFATSSKHRPRHSVYCSFLQRKKKS